MTLQEAITQRHSVRVYRNTPLSDEAAEKLQETIGQCNAKGHLHIQLIQNEPKAFAGTLARYGRFRNVTNYLVVAGSKSDNLDERAGYYGEQLVLLCQTLGLNTCWVGLSYRKIPDTYTLDEDEKIVCYIAVGYGQDQGKSHKIKNVNDVSNADDEGIPDWFRQGVQAALLAPTAVNQQKFRFEYIPSADGSEAKVIARPGFSLVGYTRLDLGIAMLHFEIGSNRKITNFQ